MSKFLPIISTALSRDKRESPNLALYIEERHSHPRERLSSIILLFPYVAWLPEYIRKRVRFPYNRR